MVILIFQNIDFLLHDVFVEIHFFCHFLDKSLGIFGRPVLGAWLHSGEELIFFFEIILFKCDFLKILVKLLKFALLIVEPFSPLGF